MTEKRASYGNFPTHEREVVVDGRYKHVEGTEYRVEKVIWDATHYEETRELKGEVFYTQVVAGKNPIGTEYKRTVENFLGRTIFEGQEVNIFELIEDCHEAR